MLRTKQPAAHRHPAPSCGVVSDRATTWRLFVACLLPVAYCLLPLVGGCQQHHVTTGAIDPQHYKELALDNTLPTPAPGKDLAVYAEGAAISTVLKPEGKKRFVSLAECIALALENGRTGDFFDQAGLRRTSLFGIQRFASPSNISDSIRVFSYDPAILAMDIEQSLSKFDAFFTSSMTWTKTDEPQNLQARVFAQTPNSVIMSDTAQFINQLVKPLPTGGLAGITYSLAYSDSNINQQTGLLNPNYRPVLDFVFEQPLLQGAGIFINELRTTHPGGVRTQVPVGGQVPGVILTRLFYDEAQMDFERRVNDLLFAVEEAYWQLYSAYWDLYSSETGLLQAHYALHVAQVRLENGRIPIQDYKQIEDQYHTFRAQRVLSLTNGAGRPGVLEAERKLRYMTGMPLEDGHRLVPSDTPTEAPFRPDWDASVQEAMARRPELQEVRHEVQVAYLSVIREKDTLLPDLRVAGDYNINAVGRRLDGQAVDHLGFRNALRNLGRDQFNDWNLELRLNIPLGYRAEHANVRRAQLQLAQRIAFLQEAERDLYSSMLRSYRALFTNYEQIKIQRARREANTEQLKARYQELRSGRTDITALLENMRNLADSVRSEQEAIADYNIALVDFERQKGTIMRHDNVAIVDGPLPAAAQACASAHIRERAQAISLHDLKKLTVGHEHMTAEPAEEQPPVPAAGPLPIPALLEKQRGQPELPESLPPPKTEIPRN